VGEGKIFLLRRGFNRDFLRRGFEGLLKEVGVLKNPEEDCLGKLFSGQVLGGQKGTPTAY